MAGIDSRRPGGRGGRGWLERRLEDWTLTVGERKECRYKTMIMIERAGKKRREKRGIELEERKGV